MTSQVLSFPRTGRRPDPLPLLARPALHEVLLIGFAALLVFTRLWETSLASYDDAYYAQKAKEMLETGNWLVPTWAGRPKFDNPPLYLWATAGLFRAFGISELAARFTSAAAGVGCVWVTYRCARRLFGHWVGFFAGAALLTTPYFLKYSRHAMLDTTQALLVAGAVLLLYLGLERDRTLGSDLAAGALIGLAVLNKSVLGYLPLVVYAVYVLAARVPPRRALRPGLVAAVGAALVIPGLWFAAATRAHGTAFLREHFGYIIWHRALHGDPGGATGWLAQLTYVRGLFVDFLPWILLSLWGVWRLVRGGEAPRRALLPICWAGTYLTVLSFAAAQKSWYLLPAFPALAILAGFGLDALLGSVTRGRERFTVGFVVVLGTAHLVAALTPVPLGRDRNRDVAALAPAIREAVPEGEYLTSLGLLPHWRYASPVQFYADRELSHTITDPEEMAERIEEEPCAAFLVQRPTLDGLASRLGHEPPVRAASGDLVLLACPP